MNKTIKILKNGDFKVVSASYGIPVNYVRDTKLQSGMDSRKHSSDTARYSYKYSFYRDSGC
tara:strand:- start:100 stop:282 length:183 start_codon:yes stop_codon:yes gene_type:complete